MEEVTVDRKKEFYERLRRSASPSSVPQSLPVLFFGNLFNATAATVGLNPSDQEYLDKDGTELSGANRRFQTLTSLGAADRKLLTDVQCDVAMKTMKEYYQPGKPMYSWFRSLDRVTRAMGITYQAGEVAHLDLIQEATKPTWSKLSRSSPNEFRALREADLPFLGWELKTFPLQLVICNGRTVFNEVLGVLAGSLISEGKLRLLKWYVAKANVAGRSTWIVGWNIPLARPTGLGASGEQELGHVLINIIKR